MKLMRVHFVALFTWVLICAVSPTLISAQESENKKAGTTVDAWRQSLPPDAQVEGQVEEIAGVAPPQPSHDETQKTLLYLERMWMDSLKSGDVDALGQIVSADFTFASPLSINVKERTRYLEYALRELKLTSYEFDKITVHLFGKTAIVSGLLKQKATVKGEDRAGNYLITDVWISRGGNWWVVSRHESPLQ